MTMLCLTHETGYARKLAVLEDFGRPNYRSGPGELPGHLLLGNLFVEPCLTTLLASVNPCVTIQHPGLKTSLSFVFIPNSMTTFILVEADTA